MEEDRYDTAVFIDDYQLLVGLGSTQSRVPPCLALIDTEKGVGGTPRQTRFHLAPRFARFGCLSLVLEEGAHKPSVAESLAPFHQDPSQQIVALELQAAPYPLVLQVGALLELRNSGEADIEWDEWKKHVAFPHLHPDHLSIFGTQVSGCRLFLVCEVDFYGAPKLDVYDFTIGGESECSRQCDEKLYGELRTLSYPEERATVPGDEFIEFRSGNGSIVFLTVSVTLSRSSSDRA